MHEPLQNFDALPDSAHVRIPTVAALFACSPATIRRGARAGRIPAPVKHFERTASWNVGQLRAFLRDTESRARGDRKQAVRK